MLNTLSKIFTLVALLAIPFTAFTQVNTSDSNTPKDNSPYSRVGLGDLVNPNFAASIGMGSLGATFNDGFQSNLVNPASLAFLKATSFDIGLYAKYANLESDNFDPLQVWSGNIKHLSLSFPIRNPINEALDGQKPNTHWGMNISLLPYSTIGYNARSTQTVEDGNVDVLTDFSGRGGTYKIQWGNAVKYNDLSVGVNIGHHFGNLINERNVLFSDTLAGYDNKLLDEISIGGFYWNAGVLYKHQFKEMDDGELVPNGKSITLGLYGSSKNTINTNTSQEYFRINRFTGARDTISFAENIEGDLVLPSSFGIGVMYENFDKFRIGIDYSTSQWSGYRNDAKPDALSDGFRIAAGGEYIPDINSYNSYRKKMHYRFGAFYEKDPRNINEQLTNYGITMGLGFPVILSRQTKSFFNLALEVGQFGTETSFKETYARINLGFTLNDNSWFYKRKFQ